MKGARRGSVCIRADGHARWIGAVAALLAFVPALGQDSSPDPLFLSDDPLALTLTVDLRALELNTEAPRDHPATLSFENAAGAPIQLDAKLRPRGHSRRQLCDFPPLRLDLPKGEVADTVFARQNKLKLVTHCVSMGKRSRNARAHVALEYLAYRMLNRLTEVSFLVRPLHVTYVDARSGREHEHVAFVIEHKRRLAARLGWPVAEVDQIPKPQLDPEVTARVDLFQFLIGNTDYSIVAGEPGEECCHNAIALQRDNRYLPIPYDFDMSGLVNKPEAKPRRSLGIRSVRQRLYRGYCRDERYLDEAVDQYVAARDLLMEEVARAAELFELSRASRMTADKFVDDFYTQVLLDPGQLERKIKRRCRE
ncbi:MAG: hypothetical protein AAF184_10295 [Pseudomonadota bacterium]